ncbi:hypothetical protein CGLO_07624 [Colletotrichum gloeosporioides Cg-14]|uniref:C2H2-type domain-containing protein n=1 Tax=Colletotrichum gloeosporioides (strain Cg-14) TaxID=1237896 RepID=T0KL60_COLGC|nr:hypothetical protein CGLO_07624 [Colletotrichum gloeosporioides Cg-14]
MSDIVNFREHILRQHVPPIHCGRCSTLFPTETELNKHHKLPTPCSPNISNSYPVGFNREQEKALRKRGRGPAEKQWKEIYKILFPRVREELIPSPHYENTTEEWDKCRRRDLDQMESYLRSELGRRLEQKSLQLPHPLENQVRRRVIEIIESDLPDVFQSYRQHSIKPMETHGLDANGQPSNSAQQSQTTYGCGLEAAMGVPAFATMTATTFDGMGQQNEQAGLMDFQIPGMDLINWDFQAS